jgi:hypothetical protein
MLVWRSRLTRESSRPEWKGWRRSFSGTHDTLEDAEDIVASLVAGRENQQDDIRVHNNSDIPNCFGVMEMRQF